MIMEHIIYEKGNISYNYNGIYKDINGEHVIEKK